MKAKIWKKNAVLATVILFVCVAVYLNWSYGRDTVASTKPSPSPSTQTVTTTKDVLTLSTTSTPDDVDTLGSVDAEGEVEPTAQPASTSENDYFANARLSRQQARDSSIAILRENGALETASQQARDEAIAAATAMASDALREAEIEGLVMAKGFTDCVAYISSDGVDVVVAAPEGGLVAEQVSQIKDIVLSEIDVSVGDIRIVGVQ